jgi:hypothetical protein
MLISIIEKAMNFFCREWNFLIKDNETSTAAPLLQAMTISPQSRSSLPVGIAAAACAAISFGVAPDGQPRRMRAADVGPQEGGHAAEVVVVISIRDCPVQGPMLLGGFRAVSVSGFFEEGL